MSLLVTLVSLIGGCSTPSPTAVPHPAQARSDSVPQKAAIETRVEVPGYAASLVVPAGWGYLRAGHAVITNSDDRSMGVVLFGAADREEMARLIGKLRETLAIETGTQEGDVATVPIGGAAFELVAYPKSTVKTHPAAMAIGVHRLSDKSLITYLSFGLEEQPAQRMAIVQIIESIRVDR
jgi:hypothetical protein